MIKQSHISQHKRNRSEALIFLPSNLTKPKKKSTNNSKPVKKTPSSNKKIVVPNKINTLLQKSLKKISRKHMIVESIDHLDEQESNDDFFFFGKGYRNVKVHQVEPSMEQIEQVPDTCSYSQRNTDQDHFSHQNKENQRVLNNKTFAQEEKSSEHLNQKQHNLGTDSTTIALLSHRQVNNYSRRSQNNSQRSQCSQTHSTIELSRNKSKLTRSKSRGKSQSKDELKLLREKTAKIQKNLKMIWDCMGELWQSARFNKNLIERQQDLSVNLSARVSANEKQLLDLKLDLGKKNRDYSMRT